MENTTEIELKNLVNQLSKEEKGYLRSLIQIYPKDINKALEIFTSTLKQSELDKKREIFLTRLISNPEEFENELSEELMWEKIKRFASFLLITVIVSAGGAYFLGNNYFWTDIFLWTLFITTPLFLSWQHLVDVIIPKRKMRE